MKKLAHKIEEIFTDVAFAEDREFKPVKGLLKDFTARLEDIFVAITFAEAGDTKTARNIINKSNYGSGQKHEVYYCGKRFPGLCTGKV
jgi:hypothetical protein